MVERSLAFTFVCWVASFSPAFAEARPSIHDLMALREIGGYRSGIAVSPAGDEVAFFEREVALEVNDYRYRLVVAPIDGGQSRVLAETLGVVVAATNGRPSGAPTDRVPQWSPDGRRLAYIALNQERVELWVADVNGDAPRLAGELAGDVERFAWVDADHLVVETATPRATLEALASSERTFGFHPDAAFEPYHSLTPFPAVALGRASMVVEVSTRAVRPATDEERASFNPMRDAPAGATHYRSAQGLRVWIAPRAPGDDASSPRLGLYVDYGVGQRECTHTECTGRMTGAWIVGGDVLFARYDGPSRADTSLYAWDPTRDRVRLLRSGDEALLGCEATGAALACLYETPAEPRRLVAIDARGALRTIYEPNPNWESERLTRIERVYGGDAYDNEGYAHLVYPANWRRGRRYPLVIVQYRSRGFLRGGVGGEYPIHALAARGYFVLSVDRVEWGALAEELSSTELQVRTELDGSELRMKLTQLETLIAGLDRRGLIDMAHIGITGMSDGAETVYWALLNTDIFAAAIVSSPPTDPSAWTLGSEGNRQRLLALGTQGPWDDAPEPWRSWWERQSIVRHASEIETPLLMQLSDGEALLGFPLAVRLPSLERPVDLYLYPGAHHVKWRPLQVLAAQERSLAWLDFWLRDIENGAENEPERLERWRALRAARSH